METNDTSQGNRRGGVYRKAEFDSYMMWKSLPTFLRGQPELVIRKMGIDDPVIFHLLKIKTQTEFAAQYNIKDLGTLTDWNKKIEKEGLLKNIYSWARPLTSNVVLALYKNATKNGKSREVKTWMDIIENN